MRILSIDRPFTAGMVTDLPAHEIGAQNSAFAQDGYSPQGVFTQRKGYEYDGSVADVANNLHGVARVKFILAAATRTVTGSASTQTAYSHNSAGAGTSLGATSTPIPRCVYRDELILCGTDGITPIQRYSGSVATDVTRSSGTPTYTTGEATVTGMTFTGTAGLGSFLRTITVGTNKANIYPRITLASTTSVTLQGIRAAATTSLSAYQSSISSLSMGYAWAAVGIYDKGTLTVSSGVATGYGTDWTTSYTYQIGDSALIIPPTGDASFSYSTSPSNGTTMPVFVADQATKCTYQITRALPFKDAANHKNSLWGTGVAQYQSRVYVGPPNWDITFPPGYTLPFDPTASLTSANANDYLMDFIDVPGPDDTDANVAILPSPNPLLVLKREKVYGIYGSFGGLSVDLIADGVGCLDIRSAQSFAEGQFWAGEGGIYWYTGGQVRDLTAGKLNREWRSLTNTFDYTYTSDFCTTWIASGHLFVGIRTNSGSTARTYICDLRDGSWQSRFTNMSPYYAFTSRISGEKEKALIVGGDVAQGRVANVASCVDGSGTAKDDANSFPRLQAYTSSALAQSTGIDGLCRLVDLDVHANVYDSGTAGSTKLTPSLVEGGGIANEADATTTLAAIDSDTVDRIDRTSYRASKQGRLHQARFAVGTLGTDNATTKVEIAQIVATFRDRSQWA